jgi:hypothetical protein
MCLAGDFCIITDPRSLVGVDQPTRYAEPRYRLGATDSTIRQRCDLPESPIQSASGPMGSEEEVTK